jgi:hypothetical protein
MQLDPASFTGLIEAIKDDYRRLAAIMRRFAGFVKQKSVSYELR